MKKALRWLFLLTKRLFKKPVFPVLLALLPILTLLYGAAARQDSGMVTIALAMEDPSDPLACQIVGELTADSPLIRFRVCGTVTEAQALVTGGTAEGAWLFPAGFAEGLSDFLSGAGAPPVTVVQRQETTALRLSREVLGGVLYRSLAQPAYISYIRENVPELSGLSEKQLLSYYDAVTGNENLFRFTTAGGVSGEPTGYLLSPLRGLLGVLTMVCGLAAALYFGQDRRTGTFDRVPLRLLPLVELGCQLGAVVCTAGVALVCLAVSGLTVRLGRELLVTALYCLCAAAFSMLLRRLLGERLLAAALPVLAVGMIAVCPVFFDITALRPLQWLLPPAYCIQAVYSDRALAWLAVYALACLLACLPLKER